MKVISTRNERETADQKLLIFLQTRLEVFHNPIKNSSKFLLSAELESFSREIIYDIVNMSSYEPRLGFRDAEKIHSDFTIIALKIFN
jgi:hypothetical protein